MPAITPMAALNELQAVSAQREHLIATSKERFAAIDAKAKDEKEQLRSEHREANRTLISTLRQAQSLGIKIEDLAAMIGKSPQALHRIEQELRKYDADN
jgi:ribosome-binding protein aMBF1 (putative translation factor)